MATRPQQGGDRGHAVGLDRAVGGGCPVTLPRGGVQHHDALVRRVRQVTGEVVGLGASDWDGALLEVEVPQLAPQSIEGRVPRDEAVVVGLELVRRHVHLVALTMVDEDVPDTPVSHHLEVARVLVDVEDDAGTLLGEEVLEVDDLAEVERGYRSLIEELERCSRRPGDDRDGPGLRKVGEWGVPLADLVHVHGGVGEVHGDPDTPPCRLREAARAPCNRPTDRARLPQARRHSSRCPQVLEQWHGVLLLKLDANHN